jgi:hypothetical protein
MISLMIQNNCSPDIICIQELWHIPDNVNYILPGYHPLVCTLRNSAQGGGVGIYVKSCFKFSLLHSKSIFIERIFETILIEVVTDNSKTIVGSLYRPGTPHPRLNPSQLFDQFLELFSQQLNDIVSLNKTIYLLGNLNLDVLRYNNCSQVTSYIDLLFSFGLLQVITKPTKPTRYTGRSATIIDHVITNHQSNAYDSVILTSQLSDHFPIVHFKKGPLKSTVPNFTEFRNFSQTNLDSFRTMLHGTLWDHVLECDDAQIAYNRFHDTFFNLYELFFPLKRVKFNRNKHKLEQWITNGLLISRKTKIKLYKLSVSNPSAYNILKFKNYRNLYNSTIRAAKKLYFEKTLKKFQSNLKKSWEILYSAVNKKSNSKDSIDQIIVNGEIFTDPKIIAEKFNIFFTTGSVASTIAQTIVPTDRPPDVPVKHIPDESLFSFPRDPVTLSEVSDAIGSLEPKKNFRL